METTKRRHLVRASGDDPCLLLRVCETSTALLLVSSSLRERGRASSFSRPQSLSVRARRYLTSKLTNLHAQHGSCPAYHCSILPLPPAPSHTTKTSPPEEGLLLRYSPYFISPRTFCARTRRADPDSSQTPPETLTATLNLQTSNFLPCAIDSPTLDETDSPGGRRKGILAVLRPLRRASSDEGS